MDTEECRREVLEIATRILCSVPGLSIDRAVAAAVELRMRATMAAMDIAMDIAQKGEQANGSS